MLWTVDRVMPISQSLISASGTHRIYHCWDTGRFWVADRGVVWVGSSLEDLRELPPEVQDAFGYAPYLAQIGTKHPDAKPLHGFGSAAVLEVVETHDGNAYRAVYTVRFADAVYVLHVFQMKSRRGIATPAPDIETIRRRLKDAERISARRNER